jgi:SPX domain protein involved in polyphosphate accumulation
LEKELDKIYEFQKEKVCLLTCPLHPTPTHLGLPQARELSHRIREAENAVKNLVEEESELTAQGQGHGSRHANGSSSRTTQDTEAQEAHGNDADEGSDDDDESVDHGDERSPDEIEDQFHLLEEEVANLVADVHDLALYTKLNVTGFMKILKVRRAHVGIFGVLNTIYSIPRNTTLVPPARRLHPRIINIPRHRNEQTDP